MKLPKRAFVILGVIICVGLLVLTLRRQSPPAAAPKVANVSQPAKAITAPALAAPVVAPLLQATVAQPVLPFPPSELLLRAKAGSFAAKAATDAVAEFTARTPEALAELNRLAASSDISERLLGLYLRLEIEGPTAAILASAASDSSPLVSSQAAEWLFFHSRFDLLKSYLQEVRSAWSPTKTEQIVSSFATSPSSSPELPAGLVILQLGRALSDMVGALLNTAPEIHDALETVLLDQSAPPQARVALLDVFQEARPAGYLTTLQKLILSRSEDSPARFKAFVNYATVVDASAGLTWIEHIPAATTSADPLGFRFGTTKRLLTEKAATPISQIRADARVQIAKAVTSATSLRGLSAADLSALNRYVEHLRDFPPEQVDAPVLGRIATLLEAEPYRDYSARRLTARVRALAAQANS